MLFVPSMEDELTASWRLRMRLIRYGSAISRAMACTFPRAALAATRRSNAPSSVTWFSGGEIGTTP